MICTRTCCNYSEHQLVWDAQLQIQEDSAEKVKHIFLRVHISTENESVPKIIINNTLNLFFKLQSAFLNHNSFRVPFYKSASVYFIWEIYLYFSIGNGQSREPALCQLYRHTFVSYNHISKLHQIFCAVILYTPGLVDDVIFSHNGPCGAGDASRVQLKMTHQGGAQISYRSVYWDWLTSGSITWPCDLSRP